MQKMVRGRKDATALLAWRIAQETIESISFPCISIQNFSYVENKHQQCQPITVNVKLIGF